MNPDTPCRLIIDPEPTEVVRLIFSLTLEGMGQIAITKELAARKSSLRRYTNTGRAILVFQVMEQ